MSSSRRLSRSKNQRKVLSTTAAISAERLEDRVLMHGVGFEANINFQKATPAAPTGYFLDAGLAYGDRGNGLAYGWDADNTTSARDRNNALSPDQRYDTLTHMQLYGTRTWEIAVPSGSYTVHVVGGDPSAADSTLGIAVEGALAVTGKSTSTQHWIEGTVTVTVSDGRLTVSNAPGAVNNKIDFIDIDAADATGLPMVGVSVSDGSAGEAGPNPGSFLVTRSGDTTSALTVNYALSGVATNGTDYQRLGGSVVIPAGAASALVTINPIDDSDVEGAEGVTLTLLPSDSYDLAGTSAASLTIADNDGATAFSAMVNFQPAESIVPAGYVADTGLIFADRGNGLSYGWDVHNRTYARDRNSSLSPDQRYDTLNQMQRTGGGRVWEIAVPNGSYTVHIVAGDPSAYDSTYAINVEGVLAVSGKPTSTVKWFEGTRTVQVRDGRLTVTNAPGSANNKIAFIDIASDNGPVLPQVSIAATDASATEAAGNGGRFTVTRTGATDQPLVVNLSAGGTASNGVDYTALGATVTIPAGAASAVVNISPMEDAFAEGTETVVLTVRFGAAYTVGANGSATVSILDDDVATGITLSWREVAPIGVGRSEGMGAVVDGKLYLFGGYVDTTFTPTRRADVYDPATNTWRQLRDLPSFAYAYGGASHVGTVASGSSIYFAGGYPAKSPSGQTFATTAVFRYDTLTDTYTSLPSLPAGRGGGALVALGRDLHFFGGSDAARADAASHWALNLDNLAGGWVSRAPLPVATNHVAGVVLGGMIYSIGGQQGQDDLAIQRADVQVYDPFLDAWSARAPLPLARSHITSATFVRDGKILVLGGLKQGNVVLNTVSSYDPAANAWTSLTPLPSGRLSGISDLLPDGRIIFSTGAGGGFRDTTWIGEFV